MVHATIPEFQQFLQHYSITHQTSSPNHPRSNGFVESGWSYKEVAGQSWKRRETMISGLFDYRVTPQSGSIVSPLQLLTQHTPRERNLPQLPSALGAPEMHHTCQELIKRQGNKQERNYIELAPGTPVWVQHRQNATWEPATVVNQCAPNSYWIMQENSAEQPRVYRCTRTMSKIRSTPTECEQTAQMKEWTTESRSIKSNIPAIPYGTRDCVIKNSQRYTSSNTVQPPLPCLDLPDSENLSENRKESQIAEPLCTDGGTLDEPDAQNAHYTPNAPETRKSTRENFGKPAKSFSDFYL